MFRNKRGHSCYARVAIPEDEFDRMACKSAKDFINIVAMDAKGAEKLEWFHHTGMGGEITAGVYKAVKINPHAPLVSSTHKIVCSQRYYPLEKQKRRDWDPNPGGENPLHALQACSLDHSDISPALNYI